MNARRVLLACATLPLLFGTAASSQDVPIPIDLEVGYQMVDVSGSEDMFRNQLNERDGFVVRSLNLSTADFGGKTSSFLDSFRLDVSELGASPTSSVRLTAGLAKTYRFRLSYARRKLFSSLPTFANPLLDSGIVPGQHGYDRRRQVLDAEIELLPGGPITPILGYTWNRYTGPGSTTYHVGQDEFALGSDLKQTDQELRAGVAFDLGPVSGQVIQGWRRFRGVEALTLQGTSSGNNGGTVLGVPVSLTGLQRHDATTANTPVTTAIVTGRLLENRVKITGTYVRSRAESNSTETEDLAGTLVSFQLSRFFGALSESIESRSTNPSWKAGARLDVNVLEGVDLTAGYHQGRREIEGFALIQSLYRGSVTFNGTDPRELLRIVEAHTALDRTEKVFDVGATARVVGPLTLRAGFTRSTEGLTLTADPSQIVVPGSQDGTFDRQVDGFEAGATFTLAGLTLGADLKRDRADSPVVRTDFVDRDRYRVRAAYGYAWARLAGTAEQIDVDNREAGVGYEGRIRQYGGTLDLDPWKPLRLRLSGALYQADSTVLVRRPVDFAMEASVHAEDGRSLEGGLTFTLARFSIDGAIGRFENKGSFPFQIDRARLRGEFEVTKAISLSCEWQRDDYRESGALADYEANRFGLYVRFRQ